MRNNQLDRLLVSLWDQYHRQNDQVSQIHSLLHESGEIIVNDHIAFRTVDDVKVNLKKIVKLFKSLGYVKKNNYLFKEKKLRAVHLEHDKIKEYPKIFISELLLSEMSSKTSKILKESIKEIPNLDSSPEDLIVSGRSWDLPNYEVYTEMCSESEYAGWLLVWGYRANHFTVSVNHLKKFHELEDLNLFLKRNKFKLNDEGVEIKGSVKEGLEQSSTLASLVPVEFQNKTALVPCCYYEFAKRYPLKNGELFQGFVQNSASQIFESTDRKKSTKKP